MTKETIYEPSEETVKNAEDFLSGKHSGLQKSLSISRQNEANWPKWAKQNEGKMKSGRFGTSLHPTR